MKSIAWSVLLLVVSPALLRAEPTSGDGWPLSAWIGRLDSSSYSTRLTAVSVLGSCGPPAAPAVPRLIELLSDAQPDMRSQATRALAAIGPAAVEPLTAALTSFSTARRAGAARALGVIGKPAKASMPALLKTLTDFRRDVRLAAAEAVWLVDGSAAGVPVLIAGLSASSLATRVYCAETLAHLGPAARDAVPALMKKLDDRTNHDKSGFTSWTVSALAARALGRIGPAARPAIPALAALLRSDKDFDGPDKRWVHFQKAFLRVNAAITLLGLGAETDLACSALIDVFAAVPWEHLGGTQVSSFPEGNGPRHTWSTYELDFDATAAFKRFEPVLLPTLLRMLDHKEEKDRLAALKCLFSWSSAKLPREVLPALRRFIAAENAEGRDQAFLLLMKAGETLDDRMTALPLGKMEAWGTSDTPIYDGNPLLVSLREGPPANVAVLVKALANDKIAVRDVAAEMLARIGPAARPAVPALRAILKKTPHAVPGTRDFQIKAWAALALFNMGENRAETVPLLLEAFFHQEPQKEGIGLGRRGRGREDSRRELIALALAPVANPQIVERMIAGLKAEDDYVRYAAAALLREAHGRKNTLVVNRLADAVDGDDEGIRGWAIILLSAFGAEARAAVPALFIALADPDTRFRLDVAQALWRIDGKADLILPILREGLKEMEWSTRDFALGIASELGPAAQPLFRDVAPLLADEQQRVRDDAFGLFCRLAPDPVAALIDLLEDKDPKIRTAAQLRLGGFGPAAVSRR